MNILHIISGGETGGSKNHLLSLSKGMKDRNIKNIVVCFLDGKLYREALEWGIDIRLVKQNKRFDLSAVDKVAEICRNEKVDIINCHGGRANFIGWFLKKKYKAVYVTTVHSDYNEDYMGNWYKTLIYSNINKKALKSFDHYITVSENFKEMLISRGFNEDKINVVYNGIDFKNENNIESKDYILKKYNLNNSWKYAVIVGRFHPVKGHRVFIDACKIVCRHIDNTGFILVGDGSIRDEIERYADESGFRERFYFTGWAEPWEFYNISEFSVMSSYTESFPLTILESAKYKKTVISTDVGGIKKLIEDGVNGYLVGVGDSDAMADRMIKLFNNTCECRAMGERLNEKAKNNYSINNMVKSYMDIYCRITGGNINE